MARRPVVSSYATDAEKARASRLANRYGLEVSEFGLPTNARVVFSVSMLDVEVRQLDRIGSAHGMDRGKLIRGMVRRCLREFTDGAELIEIAEAAE